MGNEFTDSWTEIRAKAREVFAEKKPSRIDVWVYAGGGAETGTTMRHQREYLDGLRLRMNVMKGIREPKLSTTFLGQPSSLPILIAPMSSNITGFVNHPFVELGKGALAAGIIGSVGFPSAPSHHRDMLATGVPTFKIVKPLRDRAKLFSELKAAERDGCFAVGIDIDSSAGLKPDGDTLKYDICVPLSIQELAEIRATTELPFIVKGVMSVIDAEAVVEAGADAIFVSTHGGFALDYAQAPAEVLPAIADAVGNEIEIWLDSSVQRGTDILKALALGARGVLLGRLSLWGLALGAADGVEHVLNLLGSELRRNMLLTGVASVQGVPGDVVVHS